MIDTTQIGAVQLSIHQRRRRPSRLERLRSASDSQPDSIAIDGAGSIWVANGDGAGISEFSNSGATISPATSYITGYVNNGGNLLIPIDIAVDGAGNVWVAGADNSGSVLSEFIGAATPVVTPLAGNFVAPYTHPASLL